ncbi:MD-2-related lipid-recognition protein-like [Culex pipiens pallens]|uniref:MD-2-related lipid-recognition protein-like n=1 Tax=Culex pipiens pallens TaxID=42434 RepID=UPI0022AA4B65|nr:MD-2-related lipid-recognition protein-like [Culex pipiens pallens]
MTALVSLQGGYNKQVQAKCTIHELRVNPCPEVAKHKPCVLVKGQNATISFDYTAGFDAKVATAKAWWTMPSLDLPFIGMDNDACKYTGCPIVAGRKQTYSYELPIMKLFPSRAYDVKWQLLNEKGEQCCFIIPIVIKNKRGRI